MDWMVWTGWYGLDGMDWMVWTGWYGLDGMDWMVSYHWYGLDAIQSLDGHSVTEWYGLVWPRGCATPSVWAGGPPVEGMGWCGLGSEAPSPWTHFRAPAPRPLPEAW